ncbi:hypothetical protein ACFSL6_17960 [Paenibacillus thailandensis]|uniref:Uncharacterized protein n=1 Tax=Paenibacillus thailandensis TaxID=393250 RepID=A0ABW5QRK7_9BACL
MDNNRTSAKNSYIYQVELLLDEPDHKKALQKLITELNRCDFQDYRILSGIQLGQEITSRKEKLPVSTPVPTGDDSGKAGGHGEGEGFNGWSTLRSLQSDNSLVRMTVNKGLGVKLSIPCRILRLDEQDNLVTIYHVDEKAVYTFRLTEIEDIG